MNKLTFWLGGVLVLQLLLEAGLFRSSCGDHSNLEVKPLLDFNQSQVDRVSIGSASTEVDLQKRDGVWSLPELHSLPVDQEKLQTALSRLVGLKTGWPVVATGNSHERFEVSGDRHQRSLRL